MSTGPQVVVVGASAGGVEALSTLVAGLPAEFPAAVLVALHVPASGPGAMPRILSRSGRLPAHHARAGEPLTAGSVVVAPHGTHLVVLPGTPPTLGLTHGPRENGHRPSVDVLFRSAAAVLGPLVTGVILSGALDDGAAGMHAIARAGGTTVVQHPEDALCSGMPTAVLAHLSADHVLPVAEIAPLLAELVARPRSLATPPKEDTDHDPPPVLVCPGCGGALAEVPVSGLVRFRCRLGHTWGAESLMASLGPEVEGALWMALRGLEEKADLADRLAGPARTKEFRHTALRFEAAAREARQAAALLRRLLEDPVFVSALLTSHPLLAEGTTVTPVPPFPAPVARRLAGPS